MTLSITWYGKHEDFSPNYDDFHHGTITGDRAAECMAQLRALKQNHDLAKFTCMQIAEVWD